MAKGDFTNNDRVKTDIPVYLAPISQEEFQEILGAIEGLWWQFGSECGDKNQYRHSCGYWDLENAEAILLKHGRIEKYRKNGKMDWYKFTRKP